MWMRTLKAVAWLTNEPPLLLFVMFNAVMGWLVWSLTRDIAVWKAQLANGEPSRVPFAEPGLSQSILEGLPTFWLAGAVVIGVLAAYWHVRNGNPTPSASRELEAAR